MGKKSSRRRSQARSPNRRIPAAAEARPAPLAEKAQPVQAPASRAVDLAAEYHYVYSDLKRIGILAASMLALLVALALLAQYVF